MTDRERNRYRRDARNRYARTSDDGDIALMIICGGMVALVAGLVAATYSLGM